MDDAFQQASAMGLNVARTWAHSITNRFPFQLSPGKYDEKGIAALDYVLDSASRHGIHLILSFIDNWKYYNGVDQVRTCLTDSLDKWCGIHVCHDCKSVSATLQQKRWHGPECMVAQQ